MTDSDGSIIEFNEFKISKNQNDKYVILNKGDKLTYCKTRCDFKFNYGDLQTDLEISSKPKKMYKLTPGPQNNFNIEFNNTEYNLEHIIISQTYHLYLFDKDDSNVLSQDESSDAKENIGGKNFIEIFFCHKSKTEDKNLVVCLIVSKKEGLQFNEVNGINLGGFFREIKQKKEDDKMFSYKLNNLFKTYKKDIWGNSFYYYENGNFYYDLINNNDFFSKQINNVIVMKDIYYCSADVLQNLFGGDNLYVTNQRQLETREEDQASTRLSSNDIGISFNLEGTKNSNPGYLETEYDLIDCQEYTGLEDKKKENDKLIVNDNEDEEGTAEYVIRKFNEYKMYIIAFIFIIIQVILFYYLLKYVYNKWNPNEKLD